MKIKAKKIFLIALGTLLLSLPAARAATANASTNAASAGTATNVNLNATMMALFGDPVIAKGKGFEIKQSDLDEMLAGIKSAAAMRNQVIPPNQMKLYEVAMLNRLIQTRLLMQKATGADIAEGKQEFEKTLQQIKASQKLTDTELDQRLNQQLQLQNMTREKWDQENIDQATVIAVLERELKITVTDAEARKFYDDHPAEFEQPEMVQIAQIFLSTHDPLTGAELSDADKAAKKKEIEDILKRARAGENFSNLVEQFSEDPGSKDKGGVITIPRGQTLPEFEAAAFSLDTNQISDVVTTAIGYHLIKLLEKMPAKTPDYATVADGLKQWLIQQKAAKLAPPYIATLRKEAGVEILDPDLNAAEQQLQSEAQSEAATNALVAPEGK